MSPPRSASWCRRPAERRPGFTLPQPRLGEHPPDTHPVPPGWRRAVAVGGRRAAAAAPPSMGGARRMSLRVRYVGLDRIAAVVAPADHCIAVPEYLFAAAAQLWPGRRVLPHYGLHPGDPPPDLAILHKGLLNRLSRAVLRDILDAGRPVLATEDFLLVRPALRVAADSVRLDWLEDAARLRAWAVRP